MVIAFEKYLAEDPENALQESWLMSNDRGEVQRTLKNIAARLESLNIPYALAGAMGLLYHGYQRFTHDIDIIVTRESLQRIHEKLAGLGYTPLFKGSKNLRDTETGVRIDFIVSGGYPGDGKPKPVTFPDPKDNTVAIKGVRVLSLPKLIDLKLASGLSGGLDRAKDISDVVELVKILRPDRTLADQVDPSVRDKFLEIIDTVEKLGPSEF